MLEVNVRLFILRLERLSILRLQMLLLIPLRLVLALQWEPLVGLFLLTVLYATLQIVMGLLEVLRQALLSSSPPAIVALVFALLTSR